MMRITCGTTLRNLGWQEAWYVADGGMWGWGARKHLHEEKLTWLVEQGIRDQCVETMGGWSFQTEQAALQFVLAWGQYHATT
jgi:hypothetical protein